MSSTGVGDGGNELGMGKRIDQARFKPTLTNLPTLMRPETRNPKPEFIFDSVPGRVGPLRFNLFFERFVNPERMRGFSRALTSLGQGLWGPPN